MKWLTEGINDLHATTVISYSLLIFSQRAAIAQAFDEYKKKTCVRFVPRNDDDFDYVYIKRNVAFGWVFLIAIDLRLMSSPGSEA